MAYKPFRKPRRKVCRFCKDNMYEIDYKRIEYYQEFLSDRGKISPRRISGMCNHHQLALGRAVKRARTMALM